MKPLYDISGNGVRVGSVLQGFGLHNAGRYYTVKEIEQGGRMMLEEHRTARTVFQAKIDYYCVVEN